MNALHRAMTEADRAQLVMLEEGVPTDHMGLKLAFIQAGRSNVSFKKMPRPGKLGAFFTAMEEYEGAIFPGILWALWDEEANTTLAWVTAFSSNAHANALLVSEADSVLRAAQQKGSPVIVKDG